MDGFSIHRRNPPSSPLNELDLPSPLLRTITTLPFVISTGAQRSGEICGSSGPFLEMFSCALRKNVPKKEHPHRDLSTALRSGRDDKGESRYGP
jgi:hypothetical protein